MQQPNSSILSRQKKNSLALAGVLFAGVVVIIPSDTKSDLWWGKKSK